MTYEHGTSSSSARRRRAPERPGAARRQSAYFWGGKNAGSPTYGGPARDPPQLDAATRKRSGAYPFGLPYRLILMHSLRGEVVLDPFAGTGTTSAAALAAGRNSIGVEFDPSLLPHRRASLQSAVDEGGVRARDRRDAHVAFVRARTEAGRPPGHHNSGLDVPVMTRQERELVLTVPTSFTSDDADTGTATHRVLTPDD